VYHLEINLTSYVLLGIGLGTELGTTVGSEKEVLYHLEPMDQNIRTSEHQNEEHLYEELELGMEIEMELGKVLEVLRLGEMLATTKTVGSLDFHLVLQSVGQKTMTTFPV
jgi:hypothetical protein